MAGNSFLSMPIFSGGELFCFFNMQSQLVAYTENYAERTVEISREPNEEKRLGKLDTHRAD